MKISTLTERKRAKECQGIVRNVRQSQGMSKLERS